MKVVHVNLTDIHGGAARAAHRLYASLKDVGIDCQMLVQRKETDDADIIGPGSRVRQVAAKLLPVLDAVPLRKYHKRSKTPFSPNWVPLSAVVDRLNRMAPDIVHLHWIGEGMIRIEDIARIKAPIVWSLHDMWPFTGGCHYDELCGGFRNQCGNCKVLGSNRDRDLSRHVLLRKKKAYAKKQNITVIGLSRWMAEEAENSVLFSKNRVLNLPNPIQIDVFSPFDTAKARQLLNLPLDKKLILFGAMGATSDRRKGFSELSHALKRLGSSNTELVVFGASRPQEGQAFEQNVHYLGQLHDDVTLRVLYNAADVMVVPSLQENLSNAILESLACGTPVVGFDIGGNSDLIEHRLNGYLAAPEDVPDLAAGIDWVLQHADPKTLSSFARASVEKKFDSKKVAERYIELYRSVLDKEIQ